MVSLLLLWMSPASAATDCAIDTDGYVALRRSLRRLRVAQGHPITAAGSTPECDEAVHDVVRNDPLLGVHHAEGDASGWDRVQSEMLGPMHCGAVVVPGESGFRMHTVGDCIAPLGADDTPQRIWSAAWWAPGGVSLRWTESLGGGMALLADGAVQLDTATMALQQEPAWRLLGGVDLSELGLLTSMVMGARFGVQDRALQGPGSRELVGQFHLGRRWVGRRIALQLGAGVVGFAPVVPDPTSRTGTELRPSAEVRLGLPTGW